MVGGVLRKALSARALASTIDRSALSRSPAVEREAATSINDVTLLLLSRPPLHKHFGMAKERHLQQADGNEETFDH